MAKKSKSGSVERVDTGSFDDAISALNAASDALSNANGIFVSSTEQLLSCWEGYGKNAFKGVYTKLKTKLNDQEDNLITIKDDLIMIKQNYADWDTSERQAISSLIDDSAEDSSGGGGGGGGGW